MIKKRILPLLITMLIISSIGVSAANTSFNTTQISQSAGTVKSYVETNYSLPNNVTVGNQQVTTSQFLYLLITATQNIAKGNRSSITLKNVSVAPNPSENMTSGVITKSEYLSLASKINAYINANSKLPNYLTTSLGKMQYQSLIYMYSKILNYYKEENQLPGTISVKSWYSTTLGPPAKLNGTANYTTALMGKNSYGTVQKLGTFGTGPNKVAIIIGVHPQEEQAHIAMLNAIEALAPTLKNVQICVYKINVYNGLNYETGRKQGQDLANKYVVPNIDTSYKLVIDIHGNRGNYYNGTQIITNSIFAPDKGAKSLNCAYKIINITNGNLKYYSVPDGTSPKYVTLPIAAKGVPTLIYEQYLNQANYAHVLYNNAVQIVKAINAAFA